MNAALEQLRAARVVAAATESFFGLLADALRPAAVDQLLSLKPRGADKGVPLLLPTREAWGLLVEDVPPLALRLADAFWPGPLSIALPARSDIDQRLALGGTLAVRLPGPCAAAELARASGRVLTATSANLPGAPPACLAADVRRSFPSALDSETLRLVEGTAPGGQPSTVVIVRGDALEVVREGAIPAARLYDLAG